MQSAHTRGEARAAPAATARRLLWPQLRWVGQLLDDAELAYRLGVVALVEACRDEHLASLDADEGLAGSRSTGATSSSAPANGSRSTRRAGCRRCGARLPRRRDPRCKRCGLPEREPGFLERSQAVLNRRAEATTMKKTQLMLVLVGIAALVLGGTALVAKGHTKAKRAASAARTTASRARGRPRGAQWRTSARRPTPCSRSCGRARPSAQVADATSGKSRRSSIAALVTHEQAGARRRGRGRTG